LQSINDSRNVRRPKPRERRHKRDQRHKYRRRNTHKKERRLNRSQKRESGGDLGGRERPTLGSGPMYARSFSLSPLFLFVLLSGCPIWDK
jgi:hypothetical protein